MRLLIATALVASATMLGFATAQRITSKTDSLGYTHYNGSNRDGQSFSGTSKTDSLGYTHSQFNDGGRSVNCTSKKDSLGYTRTDCH
jgi:hypothetical protein